MSDLLITTPGGQRAVAALAVVVIVGLGAVMIRVGRMHDRVMRRHVEAVRRHRRP